MLFTCDVYKYGHCDYGMQIAITVYSTQQDFDNAITLAPSPFPSMEEEEEAPTPTIDDGNQAPFGR